MDNVYILNYINKQSPKSPAIRSPDKRFGRKIGEGKVGRGETKRGAIFIISVYR